MAKRGKKEPSLFDGDGGGAVVDTGGPGGPTDSEVVELHEAAQTRYLNYALSVITSRALPDGPAPHPLHDVAAEPHC